MNIAVDMTPYIAGGANGGVVPLVIATIKELVARSDDDITIITTAQNYDALAFLDTERISRCVIDGSRKSWEETVVQGKNDRAAESVHAEHYPIEITAVEAPKPGLNKWKKKLFYGIKKPAKKILPAKTYFKLKMHKGEFKQIVYAASHPWKEVLKPASKWIVPHGIYVHHQAKKVNRSAVGRENTDVQPSPAILVEQIKSLTKGTKIEQVTGKKIDVFYCPFTAVPMEEPGVPIVSVVNDIQHRFFPWFFSREECEVRDRFYENLVKVHPYMIAISEYTRQTYIDTYKYEPDQITTVHCAVQDRLSGFKTDDDQILTSFGLTAKSFLLYPANFWPHKNHRSLFVAFNMLKHHRPDCDLKLVLTGFSGDGNHAWKEAVEAMGLENEILFLGYVTDPELAVLLRNCQFMVFPSLFEGFGMPVTEAMSMNTTVLCSNVTSIPEVGGDCAFYFDPYDPAKICEMMEYVLDHPETVKEKKENYRKHLENFSTENYIKKTRDIFRQLIEKGTVS